MDASSLKMIILVVFIVVCIIFLIAMIKFGKHDKKQVIKKPSRPSAADVLGILRDSRASFESLERAVGLAKSYYSNYMREYADFDMIFIRELTGHKNAKMPLISDISSYFKKLSPSRSSKITDAMARAAQGR